MSGGRDIPTSLPLQPALPQASAHSAIPAGRCDLHSRAPVACATDIRSFDRTLLIVVGEGDHGESGEEIALATAGLLCGTVILAYFTSTMVSLVGSARLDSIHPLASLKRRQPHELYARPRAGHAAQQRRSTSTREDSHCGVQFAQRSTASGGEEARATPPVHCSSGKAAGHQRL
eukprot:485655-Prymnesium_polylepis.1